MVKIFSYVLLIRNKNCIGTNSICQIIKKVPGKNLTHIIYYIFETLIISENTPAAVTAAPAPYPFIIIGNS